MSGSHSALNVKNYQFLYPSVALWQDFNDLDLLDSKKKKSGKRSQKGKKSSYSSKCKSKGRESSNKMKRKNPAFGQSFGAFIRPSEFTLEYSVLLPSSRAGVRLKPIDNAPVPKIDKRNKKTDLPNVTSKPKFYVPERATEVIEEEKTPLLKPIKSWNPPDVRENTEFTKEPTLYLDLNYGSDGDVDMVELHDSTHTDTKKRSVKIKSNKNEVRNAAFPQISQDMAESLNIVNDSSNLSKPGVCEVQSVAEKVPEITMIQATEALPKLANCEGEVAQTTKNDRLVDNTKTENKTRTLPYITSSQGRAKATARYTVKSRYMKPNTRPKKIDDMEPRMKTSHEFLVGGGKATNRKKVVNISRRPKAKNEEKRLPLFEKKKAFEARDNGREASQKVVPDNLPNICDDMTSLKCDQVSDEISDGTVEASVDFESPQENAISAEASPPPKLPTVVSTRLEEFEIDLDERRTGTPRLLECPFRKMKKNQRELFDQKRAAFRKLDADGDGHLSLFELMKSFPEDLTKFQIEYLTMIYKEACSSTFFGLEEFLCVDEMCSTMKSMSEELQVVFSKTNPRDVRAKLKTFLSMFLAAYDSSIEAAVFPGLSEKARALPDDASLKKLFNLFKILGKDIDSGIRKPDFLLMIPFVLEKDAVVLESIFD